MTKELEKKIIHRLNEFAACDEVAVESIDSSDPELREIMNFFQKPLKGNAKLIDVGSGKGKFCQALQDRGFRVTGVEPANKLLEIAQNTYKEIPFIKASATTLPFPDNTFDFLICVETIEHIPDTENAIREMMRVLKNGGKFMIIDKNIFSLRGRFLIPTFFWKRILELTGRWVYPRDFPFREKYFNPWSINKLIKTYAVSSQIAFVQREGEKKIHNVFPFLRFLAIWRGIK